LQDAEVKTKEKYKRTEDRFYKLGELLLARSIQQFCTRSKLLCFACK